MPRGCRRCWSCWVQLQPVTLNGAPLRPDFRFYTHPAIGLRGIVAHIPTAGLPRGENVLTVGLSPRAASDGRPRDRVRRTPPRRTTSASGSEPIARHAAEEQRTTVFCSSAFLAGCTTAGKDLAERSRLNDSHRLRPRVALSPARPFARSSRRLATPPPNYGGGVVTDRIAVRRQASSWRPRVPLSRGPLCPRCRGRKGRIQLRCRGLPARWRAAPRRLLERLKFIPSPACGRG